jgi:hypothetical protein
MPKIISVLIVIAIIAGFARMAFLKLKPIQSKSEFKRQLDIILWIPPALIALSAAWFIAEGIFHLWHR